MITVPEEIQRRFFSTIGIDYMEGSVNALPLRESTMSITGALVWIGLINPCILVPRTGPECLPGTESDGTDG